MKDMIKTYKIGLIAGMTMLMLHEDEETTSKTIKKRLAKEHGEYSWSTSEISKELSKYDTEGSIIMSKSGDASLPIKEVIKETKKLAKETTEAPKAEKQLVPGETVDTNKVKTLRTRGMGKLSKADARKLMENNKGHFFSAEFTTKKNKARVINCQYLPNQENDGLGYVKVREASKMRTKASSSVRNINMQTLKYLKIGGTTYKVG